MEVSAVDETKYWLWLLLNLGAGSRASVRLVRTAGSAKAVWDDLSDELEAEARLKPAVMDKLRQNRDLSEAEDILAKCAERKVSLITPDMPEYPKTLLCLMDYPMVLFCMGTVPDFNNRFCCAVVGTRDMSEYGKKMAYDIGWGLGDGGAVVVSGLALGIDGMVMAGAQAAGGVTVGVLGCGIDITYPPEHKDLFSRTRRAGAVMTEYPPGTPPVGGHFPVRNRIISGLCQATAVIEADKDSGALITAKHAIYQGRLVFAVPGNADEKNAEGCNSLIAQGSTILTNANDILNRFEFLYPHYVKPARKTPSVLAGVTAAVARVASSADPKSKYQGDGVYGGRKKRSSPEKSKIEAEITAEKEKAETLAKEKTEQMRHIHIDMLGDRDRAIYRDMLPNTPMLPDEIAAKGYDISEVMVSMTMLEIAGAVEAGAGGYYIRTSDADDLLEKSAEELSDPE